MNESYKVVTNCRCCNGSNLTTYLDLTSQPPANSYHTNAESIEEFPLSAVFCTDCYHSMLNVVVNPDLLFKHYLYVSGTSKTLNNYFDMFADMVGGRCRLVNPSVNTLSVLDIACNDGTQLTYFKTRGWETYGVDPALNLIGEAQSKGHTVIPDYWNLESARKLGRTFDAIVAQNVFAHVDDVFGFLVSCKEVMHDDTLLFIQTSQSEMFVRNEFDTMYHEHLSFFNAHSMKTICDRVGLHLHRVDKTDIHGTSYLFTISRKPITAYASNLNTVLDEERTNGLYDLSTYIQFGKNAHTVINELLNTIDKLKSEGYTIIGLGAAAKAMTAINFGKLNLDLIIDENPLKIGRYTPGMNILIQGFDCLPNFDDSQKIAFLLTAWNFEKELKGKVKAHRNNYNDVFIKYFPAISITN